VQAFVVEDMRDLDVAVHAEGKLRCVMDKSMYIIYNIYIYIYIYMYIHICIYIYVYM